MTGSCELRPLDRTRDLAIVTMFCDGARDYLTLESGETTGEDAARRFFDDAPPNGCPPRKLGAFDGGGGLCAIADLAIGYPEPADAFIGLLLLAPAERGHGLGRSLFEELARMARDLGAERLLVGVLEANPRGLAFWRSLGFAPTLVRRDLRFGALTHTVIRMERPVG